MSRKKPEVYPSDLSDEQWELVAPVLRVAIGRNGCISRRRILNAIFYVHRTGCQWRFLPQSYPHWKTVYSCFWRWQQSGVWDVVLDTLLVEVRYEQGRKARPTAASVDSQSVKSTEKGGLVATTEPKSCLGASV
jgi:putative transposase